MYSRNVLNIKTCTINVEHKNFKCVSLHFSLRQYNNDLINPD